MPTNISVRNWLFTVMAKAARTRFSSDGSLASVHRMTARETGHWYGFGFVAMAIEAPEVSTIFDHTDLNGWWLRARRAIVRDARSSRWPSR